MQQCVTALEAPCCGTCPPRMDTHGHNGAVSTRCQNLPRSEEAGDHATPPPHSIRGWILRKACGGEALSSFARRCPGWPCVGGACRLTSPPSCQCRACCGVAELRQDTRHRAPLANPTPPRHPTPAHLPHPRMPAGLHRNQPAHTLHARAVASAVGCHCVHSVLHLGHAASNCQQPQRRPAPPPSSARYCWRHLRPLRAAAVGRGYGRDVTRVRNRMLCVHRRRRYGTLTDEDHSAEKTLGGGSCWGSCRAVLCVCKCRGGVCASCLRDGQGWRQPERGEQWP